MAAVVSVLGGKHHSRVVAQGVGQTSRQINESYGIVTRRAFEVKSVFDKVSVLLPVFQLDVKDRVPLRGKGVHFLEAQPKLTCERKRGQQVYHGQAEGQKQRTQNTLQ